MKKEHLAALVNDAKNALEAELTSPLSHILETVQGSTSAMWTAIRVALETAVHAAEVELKPRLAELSIPEEQLRKHMESLRAHGPVVVRKCVRDSAQHLALMMQKRFDELFNFDENKLPRRWKRRDDIPKIYKVARQKASCLAEHFSLIRLNPEDDLVICCPDTDAPQPTQLEINDTDPRVVLTRKDRNAVLERFRENTHAAFKSAIQEQELAKASGPNPLFWILLLVLGWNEMLYIFSYILGPMLIPILFFAAVIGYLIWKGNLGGPAMGMMQGVAMSAARQAWGQVQGMAGIKAGAQQAHPKAE